MISELRQKNLDGIQKLLEYTKEQIQRQLERQLSETNRELESIEQIIKEYEGRQKWLENIQSKMNAILDI